MNDHEFRVLLDLCMVSDPWPLTDSDRETFDRLLRRESKRRGFDGWVDAYHEFDPTIPEPDGAVGITAWDEDKEVIEADFPNGVRYQFIGVPPAVQREWRESDEPGQYYQENIRGEYRYVRVSGA